MIGTSQASHIAKYSLIMIKGSYIIVCMYTHACIHAYVYTYISSVHSIGESMHELEEGKYGHIMIRQMLIVCVTYVIQH